MSAIVAVCPTEQLFLSLHSTMIVLQHATSAVDWTMYVKHLYISRLQQHFCLNYYLRWRREGNEAAAGTTVLR